MGILEAHDSCQLVAQIVVKIDNNLGIDSA
jgi:hypothetical protein